MFLVHSSFDDVCKKKANLSCLFKPMIIILMYFLVSLVK